MKYFRRYPFWFPYPSSWLRGIALILVAFPIAMPIFFSYWMLTPKFIENSSIFRIVLLCLFLLLIIAIFSCLYYYFWYRKISKTPRKVFWSIWECTFATIVITLSFTLLFTLFFPLIKGQCELTYDSTIASNDVGVCIAGKLGRMAGAIFRQTSNSLDTDSGNGLIYRNEDHNWVVKPWLFIWLIITVYIYQIEYLILRSYLPSLFKKKTTPIEKSPERAADKNNSETNESIPQKTVNIVDDELQKLKKDMGID